MENRFEKWDRWLESIYIEITNLSRYRYIFREVQKIINNNPKIQKPSVFYEYFGVSYSALIFMGIRRQVKTDKNSISFARLLEEIIETPDILSRTRYVSLYKVSPVKHLADEYFDKFYGKGKNYVDPELFIKDLNDLQKKAKLCECFTDKTIAHRDIKEPKTIPTFKDVNDCIDLLEELMKKYYALFRAASLVSILPTFQYDWKEIFKKPWIPD